MLKKSVLAAIAAAFLALGPLSLTATTASAAVGGTVAGNAFAVAWNGNHDRRGHAKHGRWNHRRVCKPTFKRIKVWRWRHGWVWTTVYAGKTCFWWPPAHRWH